MWALTGMTCNNRNNIRYSGNWPFLSGLTRAHALYSMQRTDCKHVFPNEQFILVVKQHVQARCTKLSLHRSSSKMQTSVAPTPLASVHLYLSSQTVFGVGMI